MISECDEISLLDKRIVTSHHEYLQEIGNKGTEILQFIATDEIGGEYSDVALFLLVENAMFGRLLVNEGVLLLLFMFMVLDSLLNTQQRNATQRIENI